MLKDIHVFDDIISSESQDLLESFVIDTNGFKFGNNLKHFGVNFPQYVFAKSSSDAFPHYINQIFTEIQHNTLSKVRLINSINWRTKINKLVSSDKPSDSSNYSIHIDRDEEHLSLVYYINNSSGDTVFYKLKDTYSIDNWKETIINREFDAFIETNSIPPQKGRVVLFNGKTFHRSTYPTNGDRYVVNMNFNYNNKQNKKLF